MNMNQNKTKNKTVKSLKTIEKELESCFNVDRKNWVKIFQLMSEVQDEKLYEQEKISSFTGWVNKLATDIGCHVSLLWNRLKAGRTYDEYYNRQLELGMQPKPIEEISVSPDSLNLASTVAGRNAKEMDNLIDKVISGDLTRDDLRQAARAKRSFTKEDIEPTTRHNRASISRTEDAPDASISPTTALVASDIVLALRGMKWLKELKISDYNDSMQYKDYIYKTFTEFRADVGISKATRQIDLLAVENYNTPHRCDDVVMHGIEIKVDINDLKRDHKMAEYTNFCDYFYIAIPNDKKMIKEAKSLKLEAWGLIVVDDKKGDKVAKVLEPAQRLKPLFREKSLSNIILRDN